MRLKAGTDGGGYVSCLAAATAQDGFIHYMTKERAGIKKEDVIVFLKTLKKNSPSHNIVVFCDNGSCFTANDTKYAANDLGVTILYNLPYRPDFNGMENVWRQVKAHYRNKIVAHLCSGVSWKNSDLVTESIQSVDRLTVRNGITAGLDALDAGNPINPVEGEDIDEQMNDFIQ